MKRLKLRERIGAIAGERAGIPLVAQDTLERFSDARFVIDDQDRSWMSHGDSPPFLH